jgi:hypothetical protein
MGTHCAPFLLIIEKRAENGSPRGLLLARIVHNKLNKKTMGDRRLFIYYQDSQYNWDSIPKSMRNVAKQIPCCIMENLATH